MPGFSTQAWDVSNCATAQTQICLSKLVSDSAGHSGNVCNFYCIPKRFNAVMLDISMSSKVQWPSKIGTNSLRTIVCAWWLPWNLWGFWSYEEMCVLKDHERFNESHGACSAVKKLEASGLVGNWSFQIHVSRASYLEQVRCKTAIWSLNERLRYAKVSLQHLWFFVGMFGQKG